MLSKKGNIKKYTALFIFAIITFSVLFSGYYVSSNSDHDCILDNKCSICEEIRMCVHTFKSICILGINQSCIEYIKISIIVFLGLLDCNNYKYSPVGLKVRMNN